LHNRCGNWRNIFRGINAGLHRSDLRNFNVSASSRWSCVMYESSQRVTRLSTVSEEQSCRFGTVVRALWPDKPALHLAQKIGCTERAANFYIRGSRDPSLGAILVIVDEIRGRRRA
jgi:hypothetical protein